jgi:hypothetical protein
MQPHNVCERTELMLALLVTRDHDACCQEAQSLLHEAERPCPCMHMYPHNTRMQRLAARVNKH